MINHDLQEYITELIYEERILNYSDVKIEYVSNEFNIIEFKPLTSTSIKLRLKDSNSVSFIHYSSPFFLHSLYYL